MSMRFLIILGVAVAVPPAAWGQAEPRRAVPESVTVVADSTFGRGGLRRFLLGSDYRDLWATPIRVEVLDLQRFAGGLKPLQRGGGLQTVSLRLQGADGREYQFRRLKKDLQFVGPRSAEADQLARLFGVGREDFRGTFVGSVVRDQISSLHPGASLMLPPILEAGRVLHAPPLLRYMPDDPLLGAFRNDFGNQLGTIEERPAAGEDAPPFAGAEAVESTGDLLERLEAQPGIRVDTRGFLTARLLDFFVGDWDRHEDQWRWALLREGDSARWYPIPRDRDYAFVRYDGLLMGLVRHVSPKLLVFDRDYASPWAASYNGRHLDRRILNDLEWPVWDSVARALQSRLTDQVIDQAVDRLPAEYEAQNGAFLRRTLRVRRDNLHRAAERYYRFLAEQVIIQAGKEDDWAEVVRHPEGRTEVRVGQKANEAPYYLRNFTSDATDEIRIYLGQGADRAVVRGDGQGPKVRLIGGGGQDTLIERSRHRNSRFYDAGDGSVAEGRGVDRKPYAPPVDTSSALQAEQDWGQLVLTMPMLEISSDVGLGVGLGVQRTGYGFRRQPYASRHTASLERSFLRKAFRVRGSTRWRVVNRQTYFGLSLLGSGLEGLRFYGFGNGTEGESPIRDRFLVFQQTFEVSPYVGFRLEEKTRFLFMVRSRHTVTNLGDPTNTAAVINDLRPLGVGDFGQIGPAARFEHDSRDHRFGATKGLHLVVEGDYYPITWASGGDAFGSVEGTVSTYLTPIQPGRLTLALRAGGRRVWGEFPYFEAAFLGGKSDLRGYPSERFAGHGSLFGNAELRIGVANVEVFLPAEFGIFGLADAGRVFFEDDPSSSWHTDFGGGITLGFLQRSAGLRVGMARGSEGVRFHLRFGMDF